MEKSLLITTSPTTNGNGDTLITTAINTASEYETDIERINLREHTINACKACGGCMEKGECIQQDDFNSILSSIKKADKIIVTVPIYMNLPCAQATTLLNRFFTVFSPKYEKSENPKNVTILITMGNSDPEEMKKIIENSLVFFQIENLRIETFNQLSDGPDVCKNTPEYIEKVKKIIETLY